MILQIMGMQFYVKIDQCLEFRTSMSINGIVAFIFINLLQFDGAAGKMKWKDGQPNGEWDGSPGHV